MSFVRSSFINLEVTLKHQFTWLLACCSLSIVGLGFPFVQVRDHIKFFGYAVSLYFGRMG